MFNLSQLKFCNMHSCIGTSLIITLLLMGCSVKPLVIDSVSPPKIVGDKGMETARKTDKTVETMAEQSPDKRTYTALLSIVDSITDTPIFSDSRADLLIDGPATYAAMLEAIKSAKQFIHIETYIFSDDETGQQFAETLKSKASEGVEIQVIYDAIGSMSSRESFFAEMADAGIELIEYHNINPVDGGNPLNANIRDHRKLLIVDGVIAFTGGMNISGTYASSSGGRPKDPITEGWRDTHISIHGPAVEGFRKIFEDNWVAQGGSVSEEFAHPADLKKAGSDLIASLSSSGGDGSESPIYRAYVEAIRSAKESIWITQAYFTPDKAFLTALKEAGERGVDVRIIVPGISDSKAILHASKSRYGSLMRAGIKIYENTNSLMHAKTAVVDGIWSTVGSSNLDSRSFIHNHEVNAIIFGADFGAQMQAQFNRDIKQCQAVTLTEWKDRSLLDRLKELFYRLFEYWI